MTALRLLDGGMGRELQRIGAPFRQPEWSALALIESPEYVLQAHRAFIDAGARVVTSNSYALVPFHLGEERFAAHGQVLAERAGRLAREAAGQSAEVVAVAGSLPPALGSYRPDLFDHQRSVAIHRTLIEGLRSHVDVWLAETQSSIAEVRAVHQALSEADALQHTPLWLSFTLSDEPEQGPRLRSGESVAQAVGVALELGAEAVLFNCSQPEVMGQAVIVARQVIEGAAAQVQVGVYANAFPAVSAEAEANATLLEIRQDLGPESYLRWARCWVEQGANIVGGCCGIGPEHIAELHGHLLRATERGTGQGHRTT
ncbi:homocysteine S-methyltransferase family protein [Pseudomonas sp. NPDC090202]|uniref:homocysteine S-methyltransferase family protein n=1 Tax=unclassified Pseudomonas TaxID=196821 RepID=UPI003813D56A